MEKWNYKAPSSHGATAISNQAESQTIDPNSNRLTSDRTTINSSNSHGFRRTGAARLVWRSRKPAVAHRRIIDESKSHMSIIVPKRWRRILTESGNMMRWIKSLFGPHIVALSEPYMDGRKWSYIFGDEKRFKLRTFQDAESAFGSHRIALGGLRMGSPWISIKLIELDAEKYLLCMMTLVIRS